MDANYQTTSNNDNVCTEVGLHTTSTQQNANSDSVADPVRDSDYSTTTVPLNSQQSNITEAQEEHYLSDDEKMDTVQHSVIDRVKDSDCATVPANNELSCTAAAQEQHHLSDDDNMDTQHEIERKFIVSTKRRKYRVLDSSSEDDSEEEQIENNDSGTATTCSKSVLQCNLNSALEQEDCNSDSENNTNMINEHEMNKPAKITAVEAAKQRQEIHSESQRRTRESALSLPYHKPKPRSIMEFLKKRPCLATALPLKNQVPPSVAIKMSKQDLVYITKKLEEREKEVQKFYESESESESDEEQIQKVNNTEDLANQNECDKSCTDVEINPFCTEISMNAVETDENINDINKSQEVSEELQRNVPENQAANSCAEKDNDVACISSSKILENTFVDSTKNTEECEQVSEEVIDDILDFEETNTEEHEQMSEEYVFNLDDISKEADYENAEEDYVNALINKYNTINVDDAKVNNEENASNGVRRLSKLNILKENVSGTPKLSGHPDEVIDLSVTPKEQTGITHFMERFMKHAFPQLSGKNKTKPDIQTALDGDATEDVITISADLEEQPVALMEKPGAKHQKLRGELQHQILQRRSELWQHKTVTCPKPNVDENKLNGEESDHDADEDVLEEDIEENEVADSEISDLDEEDDAYCDEKPKITSEFIDNEAEESDIEEETEVNENQNADDDAENPISINEPELMNKKKLKRILNTFSDDTDDDDDNDGQKCDVANELEGERDNRKENQVNQDTTLSWDDDDVLPPHQKQNTTTPVRKISQVKSDLEFLSPVVNLTGLQNFHPGSKNSPFNASPFATPAEPSPLRNKQWKESFQKQLFSDLNETNDTQVSNRQNETQIGDNVEQSSLQNQVQKLFDSQMEENEAMPSTQDLKDICSGRFTASPQKTADSNAENQNEMPKCVTTEEEVPKIDDQDDQFISQLLDEEELENFKKKFDSPVVVTPRQQMALDALESDEEEENQISFVRKSNKKKQKKLVFSDDEDSNEDENDLLQSDNDENEENNFAEVEYDSEENEIELTENEEATNLKDFFENEAELSESDWDSEDEDEKGLDALEFEQADNENFDQHQLKSVLEKIHMRRIMDDDNYEVKMLQELLLDDGELHGTGRQRQFKWKNIDNMYDEEEQNKDDEVDAYAEEEEENEEQWRRKRYEREEYLTKQVQQSECYTVEIGDDSSILKLGQAALRRSQTNSQSSVISEKTETAAEEVALKHQSFVHLSKRGSFLSRTDQVLNRLVQFTKVSSDVIIQAPKNPKNFIFQSSTVTSEINEDKKRKATEGTPRLLKRLRLSDASPGSEKLTEKSNRAKNLFKF